MLSSLNEIDGAIWRGNLTLIVGEKDSRKTDLMLLEAVKLADKRSRIGYFSFDTVQEKLQKSAEAFYDLDNNKRVISYLDLRSQFHCDSIDDILSKVHDLTIFDPLNQVCTYNRSNASDLARDLKGGARKHSKGVVTTWQLDSPYDINQEIGDSDIPLGLQLHCDTIFYVKGTQHSSSVYLIKSKILGHSFAHFTIPLLPI
jgi:hypothetical protein